MQEDLQGLWLRVRAVLRVMLRAMLRDCQLPLNLAFVGLLFRRALIMLVRGAISDGNSECPGLVGLGSD
jgi:hypothetical protein